MGTWCTLAATSLKGRTARTEKSRDGLREPCKEREKKSRRGFIHQDRVTEPPAAQQLGRCSLAEPGKQQTDSQRRSHIALVCRYSFLNKWDVF